LSRFFLSFPAWEVEAVLAWRRDMPPNQIILVQLISRAYFGFNARFIAFSITVI
jgi:hypothetical protein